MTFGVGGVHEANPQEEAMAPNPSGLHKVDPTFDVSNLSTPTIVLMNFMIMIYWSFFLHVKRLEVKGWNK